MSPKLVELALRKQRLQIHIEMQRQDMQWRLEGLEPALDAADRVREGARWVREHAGLIGAGALVLAAIKPRAALRTARRAWHGWRMYQRLSQRARPLLDLVARAREAAAQR